MTSNAQKIKLIVYVNFGILGISTLYIIASMTKMLIKDKDNSGDMPGFISPELKSRVIFVIVSWIFVVVFTTVINVILLKGLTQRSHTKCLIWIILAGIGTIAQIDRVVRSFLSNEYLEGCYLLIWTSVSIYGMYIVKSFMNEIRSESSLHQPLTSKP
jgi:hypothetical protein